MLSIRHVAFAALCALGMQPILVAAQVVAAPSSSGSKPLVGVAGNGVPVVQIATPNGAGVSNNMYTQYNVGTQGLILNNSQGNVLTQQGGYVGGNPNLGSGNARVILNQVIGGSPSQLLGYTEVAGARAEVVIANPSGIVCDGCGFINTSRGILTTGTPVFGGAGSLDSFHVTGGQILIGSGGLNASNVDQVDLIARSVAINGKVWAGQSLNVVAGNNDVNHNDLSAQPLGADGNSPSVAIDVAQLGGMYAGKIRLVGTEAGVGVNSAGTIASQSGDLQLSSQGKVTLSGTTSASGNVTISGASDVSNSGSVYASQNMTVSSLTHVDNTGTLAALGDTSVTGAGVSSSGALGAGIDSGGSVTGTGSLTITSSGAVSATGQQMTGGNLAVSGSSLNLTGAQTSVKGNAALTATGVGGDTGDIVHAGATLQAGGSLSASAVGAFSNDRGQIGAGQLSVTAGSLSNRTGKLLQTGTGDATLVASGNFDNSGGTLTANAQNATIQSASLTNASGQITQAGLRALNVRTGALDNSHGSIATNGLATVAATSLANGAGSITSARALDVTSAGNIDNTAGRLEASGAVRVSAANVLNAAGRIVSENGDGLSLTASGQITNASGTTAQGQTGGVIGGNGNSTIQAASVTNSGLFTAAQKLGVATQGALDNSGGTLSGATVAVDAASLKNGNGTISGNSVSLTVPQLDNTSGTISANQLSLSATNLTNEHGSVSQLGSGAMGMGVTGALDNSSGGVIQTNSTDLSLAPASLDNNGGTITHAGMGTLTLDASGGTGTVTNVGGSIVSNGSTQLSAASIENTGGTIDGQAGLTATVFGALNNTHGQLASNADLAVSSGGMLTNASGTIAATGNGAVQAATLTNSGSITAGRTLNTAVAGAFDNSGGMLSAQSATTTAASFENAGGTVSGNTLSFTVPQLDNGNGRIIANQLSLSATNLTNEHGSLTQLGSDTMSVGVRAVGASAASGVIASTGGLPASTASIRGGHLANSGLANFSNPTIASATAVTVLNNITVPQGGLFKRDTAPGATYLIETNPAFANQQQWLSSDYYFQQMGMDPGKVQLRLGDGFYEQKLVQDQLMSMTGKSVLTNYASTQDEFKSLMTSGAELAKSLDLAPGTGLSPEQVAHLTSNVVIMQTQIVDGQSVLEPVVYLAKASQENMGNGPVIAATNIDLQNAQSVTNSGTIKAANDFSISGQSIDSSFGALQAGGQMTLVTAGDVNLTSATVKARSLALQTGGDLVLRTAVKTTNQVNDNGATRINATLGPLASISVEGNAAIVTGGNFVQNAGSLNVGGGLAMNVGGDWTLGTQTTGEKKVVDRANGVSDTSIMGVTGSSVKVGGVSAIAVGNDLTASGANISLGGGGTVVARGQRDAAGSQGYVDGRQH